MSNDSEVNETETGTETETETETGSESETPTLDGVVEDATALANFVWSGACAGGAMLDGLPRFGMTFAAVESNWSALPNLLGMCTNADDNSHSNSSSSYVCLQTDLVLGVSLDDASMEEIIEKLSDSEAAAGWVGAIQSYGVYSGLCAGMGVLSLLFLLCYLLYRTCCCFRSCCCKRGKGSNGGGGGGGKDGEEADSASNAKGGKKGRMSQACAVVSLLFFVLFSLSFIMLGNKRGNQELTETMGVLATSLPVGTSNLVMNLPPVAERTLNVLANGVVGSVEALNYTLTMTVQFPVVLAAFGCIDSTLDKFGPATIADFMQMMDDVDAATAAFPDTDATLAQIATLETQTAALGPTLDDVATFITTLKATLQSLDLAAVQTALASLQTTLEGDLTPAMGDLKASLEQMEASMPATSDVSATSTSLEDFSAGPSTASADAVIASISALETKLAGLPEDTDVHIENVQTLFDTAVSGLGDLQDVFSASEQVIGQLPGSSDVAATLLPLRELLGALDLVGVKATLASLGDVIGALPTNFVEQIDLIRTIQDDLPCIMELKGQLVRVNDSLLELPAEFGDIVGELDTMNDTVSSTLGELDQMGDLLGGVEDTLNALPNTTAFVVVVDELDVTLASSITTLDLVEAKMADVDAQKGEVNLTETTSTIGELRSNLGSDNPVRISTAELDGVRALNATRATAVAQLAAAKQLVEDWKVNFGGTGTAGVCTDSAAPCGPGVGSPPCIDDLCTYTALQTAVTSTVGELDTLSTSLAAQPDFAGIITGIDDGLATIGAVPAMDPSLVGNLSAVVDDFVPEADGYGADLQGIRDSLSDSLAELDLSALSTQVTDADATLLDVTGNLASYRTTLVDLNGTLSGSGITDMVDEALDMVEKINQLLFVDLGAHLDKLRGAAVLTTIQTSGFAAGLALVGDTLDDIMKPFANATEIEENGGEFTYVGEMLRDISADVAFLDIAADRAADASSSSSSSESSLLRARGALFYLVTVFADIADLPRDYVLDVDVLEEYRVDQTSVLGMAGRMDPETGALDLRYPNSTLCLADECMLNTISLYNTKPVPDDVDFPLPLPLSREQGFMLLYALPGIVVLLALLALVCAAAGRSCVCPFVACGCTLIPFLFLMGALGLPVLMVFSDFCAYMEPTAVMGVGAIEASLCDDFGLNSTSRNGALFCTYDIDDSNMVEVDLDEIVRTVLVSCEGSSFANDGGANVATEPVAQLWAQLRNVSHAMIVTTVDDLLDTNLTVVKPVLDYTIDMIVLGVAAAVDGILEDVSETLDCEALSYVFETVKEPICCNLVNSLFWVLVPWILIALSVFICVVPALCCATKRGRGAAHGGSRSAKVWAK